MPDKSVPVERGTRWSCRQCGAERAAAWRRERFTEGFEQLVAVMERGLGASPVKAENRQRALAMAAAMIGGVAASRAVAKADPKQIACALDPALLIQAGEDTGAIRASRIGKLMTAAAAARAISAYHIH